MIDIENVAKRFKSASLNPFRKPDVTVALDGVSFSVGRGETVALVGRNGAGKSTLLKILSTVVTPDSGRALVGGVDAARRPEEAKKFIGLAGGDERSFYWRLSGRQNLILFAALQNVPRRGLSKKVGESLALFGLSDKADIPFKNYSTGMRQALALARSTLHEPEILLLDEPGKGLDPLMREGFMNFLKNVLSEKNGKTILLATHDLDMALGIAHRIALLERGKLVFLGPPQNTEHLRSLMRESAENILPFDSGNGQPNQ
jgi:ABC-2 type transport system ATP-binding protein